MLAERRSWAKPEKFRSLAIIISILLITIHYFQDYLFNVFYYASPELATIFIIYSKFAKLASFIGFVGSVRRHIHLNLFFSRFLMVDSVLSGTIRCIAVLYLFNERRNICIYIFSNTTMENKTKGCIEGMTSVVGGSLIAVMATTVSQFFLGLSVREYAIAMKLEKLRQDKFKEDVKLHISTGPAFLSEKTNSRDHDDDGDDVWSDAKDFV